jgi:hypothetical protein
MFATGSGPELDLHVFVHAGAVLVSDVKGSRLPRHLFEGIGDHEKG